MDKDAAILKLDPVKVAEKVHLRYVTDTIPGFTRKKSGDSFIYLDEKRSTITDQEILKRLTSLVIPPAWTDVWICSFDYGHLQATGKDEKGRKQYIYHKDWVEICQQNKFHKMKFFAQVLPEIRKHINAGMKENGLGHKKVLSTVLWLLDNTFIRVGNEEYYKENSSFGLTTLRTKHVDIDGNTITFDFKGKSGVYHTINVTDKRVARIIHKLEELPGYELFKYLDDKKEKHLVDSSHVNDFLKQITGEDITAKDFRTWGGTVFAASELHTLGKAPTQKDTKKNISKAVKTVAKHLHNTPATARKYYIHPVVFTTYSKNILIPHFLTMLAHKHDRPHNLYPEEYAVATLLEKHS